METSVHLSTYLVFFGVAVFLTSWLLFRQPGVPFWTQTPPWRAAKSLKPVGAWLYTFGSVIGLAGLVWHLAAGVSA